MTVGSESERRRPSGCSPSDSILRGSRCMRPWAILNLFGVDRSHGAVWNWTHRLADSMITRPKCSRRVAVDEISSSESPMESNRRGQGGTTATSTYSRKDAHAHWHDQAYPATAVLRRTSRRSPKRVRHHRYCKNHAWSVQKVPLSDPCSRTWSLMHSHTPLRV